MNSKLALLLIVVVALFVVATQAFFQVHQTKQAIVLQFGEPVNQVTAPGLNLKMPFIQNVVYIDKRLLDLDNRPEEIIASDQERLVVDAFAKFQIVNALEFYRTLNNENNARDRLSKFLSSNMRRVLGAVTTADIVSGARADLMNLIEDGVNQQAKGAGFGIVIRDVRIRRADLPQANSEAVYNRMRSERQQEAAQFRAEGEEKLRRIKAEAERERTIIEARAREESEITRGEGDALRNAIFACAFEADREFFTFYRSMQAYEEAFQSQDTTMILSPDSDFFRFFGDPSGAGAAASDTSKSKSVTRSNDPRCIDGAFDLSKVKFLQPDQARATEQ